MITNLDCLNPGAIWPIQSEADRFDKYEHNLKLFNGKHAIEYEENFKRIERIIGNFNELISYPVIINYQKLITLKTVDLMLGEEPKIEHEDELTINELKHDNNINNLAYKVAIDVSRYGDGLFYIYRDENGKGRISFTQPSLWIPVVDPLDFNKVNYHLLSYVQEINTGNQKQKLLTVQIHSKGSYEQRVYKLKGDTFGTIIGDLLSSEIFDTGLDDFAIIHVPNLQTTDTIYGHDDYTDVDSIISEILVRIGQISRILDKHASPSMQGSISALEQDPATGEWKIKAGNYFVRASSDDAQIEYITWNGQLEAAFKEIELLINSLYMISETGATLLGATAVEGTATSGTALRLKMISPQTKSKRVKMRFDPALKKALALASQLSGKRLEEKDISITWRDGIPDDKREEAEIMAIRTGNKPTISQNTAIQRLDDKNQEQADEELALIQAEEMTANPMLPPPFSGDNINEEPLNGEE